MRWIAALTEKSFFITALLCMGSTVLLFAFMVLLGLPHIKSGEIFQLIFLPWEPGLQLYGIFPMIVGTACIASLATILSFILSIGCSAFISILGPKKLARASKGFVQLMTGVPTVVYGFVGVFLLVPIVREMFEKGSGMCILSAALVLSILISPTMILIFIDHFDSVPVSFTKAVDALGGTPVQKLLYVILPCSSRGIISGLILAFGRALGDTLIALMIAGNAVAVPESILDSARTLTSHIAMVIAADFESLEFKALYVCGIVLYLFTALMVLIIRILTRPTTIRQ